MFVFTFHCERVTVLSIDSKGRDMGKLLVAGALLLMMVAAATGFVVAMLINFKDVFVLPPSVLLTICCAVVWETAVYLDKKVEFTR